MKYLIPIFFVAFIASAVGGCIAKGTYHPDEEEPLPTPPEGMTELSVRINGLSGICYNKDKTGFIAVSDKDGVYSINLAGTSSERIASTNKDLEAVAVDFSTGEIYVAEERERKIYRVSGGSLVEFLSVQMPMTDINSGLESLDCDQQGKLWIGNQEDPREVALYTIATKSQAARYYAADLTFYNQLSDFSYDTRDGSLWIADSKAQRVYHCRLTGAAPFRPFEYQSLAFMGKKAKAEALLVDSALGVMLVGDDDSGKIYKIPIGTTPIP